MLELRSCADRWNLLNPLERGRPRTSGRLMMMMMMMMMLLLLLLLLLMMMMMKHLPDGAQNSANEWLLVLELEMILLMFPCE